MYGLGTRDVTNYIYVHPILTSEALKQGPGT